MYPTTLLLGLLPSMIAAAPHHRHGAEADGKGQQQQDSMSCMQQGQQPSPKVGKAIYFLTNDAENAVVALPIGADGTLSAGKLAKTGGAGSVAVDEDGKPAAPDALVGQSALTVVGNVSFHPPSTSVQRTISLTPRLHRTCSPSTQAPTHSP